MVPSHQLKVSPQYLEDRQDLQNRRYSLYHLGYNLRAEFHLYNCLYNFGRHLLGEFHLLYSTILYYSGRHSEGHFVKRSCLVKYALSLYYSAKDAPSIHPSPPSSLASEVQYYSPSSPLSSTLPSNFFASSTRVSRRDRPSSPPNHHPLFPKHDEGPQKPTRGTTADELCTHNTTQHNTPKGSLV